MGRTKVKIKTKKIKPDDIDLGEINKYFKVLTGESAPDREVVYPKYVNMACHVRKILSGLKSLEMLLKSISYEYDNEKFRAFCERIKDTLDDVSKGRDNFLPGDYARLNNSDVVKDIIVICGNMGALGVHLGQSWDKVDRKFMNRFVGNVFTPFPFCYIDFKEIYIINGDNDIKIQECAFGVMRTIFVNSFDIYKISTSPNIDSKKLADVVVNCISKLRKQIPGCGKAFDKLEKSASIFENNFTGYYKDFTQSDDPMNIFTSFISDVATDNKSTDLSVVLQCRKIVAHFRKNRGLAGKKSKKSDAMEKMLKMYDKVDAIMAKNMASGNSGDVPDDDVLHDITKELGGLQNPEMEEGMTSDESYVLLDDPDDTKSSAE